jgi:hypothetical protein
MFASDKEASPAKDDGRSSPLEKHKHQDRPRAKMQQTNDSLPLYLFHDSLYPADLAAMVARHWRGWTQREDAYSYEAPLNEKVRPRPEADGDACLFHYSSLWLLWNRAGGG